MSNGMLKKYYQFELGQVCSRLSSGKGFAAKEISEHGIYPVFGGNGLRGYSDKKNFEGQCAIIGRQGAFCGNVRFFSGEAYMTEHAVVVCANEKSDIKYLSYLLGTMNLGRLSGQSAQPGLSVKTLSKQVIQLPDISEQRQITKVLSSFDDKIELNAQINHNLEEQLYALYASNYDNLSGKKVPLKECCSFQEGYVNPTQTKPEYFDGSVKWLRAVDINESFIISTSRTLTEQGFASAGKSALLFPKDSIAISKSGTIGRLGIVADNMCGNRAVINIVPKQKKWLAFIYCYLKSRQAEFSDLAVGSVQKNLYVSILEPLEIFSPADSVLNDFHFSAQTILEKMKNNCFEMQSLAQLRDALLPKLMSGEIDVSEVEV